MFSRHNTKKPLPHLGGATSKTDFTKKIFEVSYDVMRNSFFLFRGGGGLEGLEGEGVLEKGSPSDWRAAPFYFQEIIATEPFFG